MKINQVTGSLLAAMSALGLGMTIAGCSSEDAAPSSEGAGLTAKLDIAVMPGSAQCIRITATPSSGSATVKTFSVAAGAATTNLQLGQFAPGNYTISGDAFNLACTAISGVGAWIADPVPATLRAGVTTNLTLTFRKNNPVTITANFVNNVQSMALSNGFSLLSTDGGLLLSGYFSSTSNSKVFTRLSLSAFDASSVPGNAIVSLATTSSGACAVRADGTVWCWGHSSFGELGPGVPVGATTAVPVQVTGLSGATQIAAGQNHVCAVVGGFAYCWGYNGQGQLGDGTTTNSSTPINGFSRAVKNVSCGAYSTYTIDISGAVASWGGNSSGQLGDGTTTNGTPHYIGAGPAQAVVAGTYHACALRMDGLVRCWGNNANGQLGLGTTTDSWTPAQVPGLNARQIVAGAFHTCAIATAGQTYCWGSNSLGSLGDGTGTDRLVPTAPSLGTVTLASLAGGANTYSTCGIASTLDVYCWGYNGNGNIGDGTSNLAFLPVKPQLQ